MCGIVGLFLKDPGLEDHLGEMLAGMLVAEVELAVFPLFNDVGDVKCGRLRTFVALHEATPPRPDPKPAAGAKPARLPPTATASL